jgi:hypothetical protein
MRKRDRLGQRSSLIFHRTEKGHGDCSSIRPGTVNGNTPLYTGNDGADSSCAQAYAETRKPEKRGRLETTRALAKTGSGMLPSRPAVHLANR